MISLIGTVILGTSLGGVSIIVTTFRLWYRYYIGNLWWDDAWALGAMICSIPTWALAWVVFQPADNPKVTQHTRVVCVYILVVAFEFAVWFARLSILWTVIRLTPNKYAKRLLYALGGIFILFALILSAQKFWVCVPQKDWVNIAGGFCNFGTQVAITEIVTDIIGDALLILIPIRMLWGVRLSRPLRIRLFCIFGMSFLTTTASLAQNYYNIHDGGVKDFIVSHVETQTAVTVCNISVIVAAVYRGLYNTNLDEKDASTAASRDIVTIGGSRPAKGSRSGNSIVKIDTTMLTDQNSTMDPTSRTNNVYGYTYGEPHKYADSFDMVDMRR